MLHKKFSEVQRVSETIEKLLRQLEVQGEIINEQRTLVQQVISKYPMEVICKLEDCKQPTVPWNMKSLREAIYKYITVQENVQRYVSSYSPSVKGQQLVTKHVMTNHKQFQGASSGDSVSHRSDVLAVISQKGCGEGNFVKPALPCIFCRGGHFNDKYLIV